MSRYSAHDKLFGGGGGSEPRRFIGSSDVVNELLDESFLKYFKNITTKFRTIFRKNFKYELKDGVLLKKIIRINFHQLIKFKISKIRNGCNSR